MYEMKNQALLIQLLKVRKKYQFSKYKINRFIGRGEMEYCVIDDLVE